MKRGFDVVVALTLMLLFLPLYVIIAMILYIKMGRPILFKQRRPGYKEKIFNIYKFRTMTDEKDDKGKLLCDEKRVSAIGRFLRSTSLDELPQLFNVLKGDMSFVGPRPLLVEYLPLYNSEQKKRHNVLPGITGWAQVNGRNAISWKQKFDYDIWYVNNHSFALDMKIIGMTILKVIIRNNINSATGISTEKFKGNR